MIMIMTIVVVVAVIIIMIIMMVVVKKGPEVTCTLHMPIHTDAPLTTQRHALG
jgi:hypothetical protein